MTPFKREKKTGKRKEKANSLAGFGGKQGGTE